MKSVAEINELLAAPSEVSITDTFIKKSTSSGAAMTGRTYSKEHGKAISEGKTGKPISDVRRAALTGRKLSDEHKKNLSKASKGKPGPKKSAEWVAKIFATKARKKAEREAAKAALEE